MIQIETEIPIDYDRRLVVTSLLQWQTYKDLLCGFPTKELNEKIIQETNDKASQLCNQEHTIYLEPLQTPIETSKEIPYGTPMMIPKVACIAEVIVVESLKSSLIDDVEDRLFVDVTIVWFQESFCMPIESVILQQLREIDWKAYT